METLIWEAISSLKLGKVKQDQDKDRVLLINGESFLGLFY